MTDDLTPIQNRITKIVEETDHLDHDRLAGRKDITNRHAAEVRAENVKLKKLRKEMDHQLEVNAGKEKEFQKDLEHEGKELGDVSSKKIRDHYILETQRRETAKRNLEREVTALELQLRTTGGRRS